VVKPTKKGLVVTGLIIIMTMEMLNICAINVCGAHGPLSATKLNNILLSTKNCDVLALSELRLPAQTQQLDTLVASYNKTAIWKENNVTRSGTGFLVSARVSEIITDIETTDHTTTIKLKHKEREVEIKVVYGDGKPNSPTTKAVNQWVNQNNTHNKGKMLIGDLNFHLAPGDAQGVIYRPWTKLVEEVKELRWMELPTITGTPKSITRWRGYKGESRIDHMLINREWPWPPADFQTLIGEEDFMVRSIGHTSDHRPIMANFGWEMPKKLERKEPPPNTRWWNKKIVKLFKKNLQPVSHTGTKKQKYLKLLENMEQVFKDLQYKKPKWETKERGMELRWLRRAGHKGTRQFYSALKSTTMGYKIDSNIYPKEEDIVNFMETPKVKEEVVDEELPNEPTTQPVEIEVTMGMMREAAYCGKRKAGSGTLPPFLFHILPDQHMEIVRAHIQEVVNTGTIDEETCKYNLWLIYKGKGCRTETQNFRPIAIATPTYRMVTRIVLGELRKRYNPKLDENQYGFRPKRSCGAATMALREWREQKQNTNAEVVFLDIRKAFDSVSHRKLLKKIESTCPKNLFHLIRNIYTKSIGTNLQGEEMQQFKVRQGVRQGCALSPLLFIMYIDDVLQDLNTKFPGCLTQAFADDICLAAPDNKTLQEILDAAIGKLTEIGLQAAPMKFQFLSKIPTNTLTVGEQIIQTVVEAKYLGTTFTSTNSPKPAMANAKTEMVRALDILKKTPTTGMERVKFISTVVIPRLVYRITAWGPFEASDFQDINKEIKATLKEVKGMHIIMSDKTLYTKRCKGGLGLANPEMRTKISGIRLWQETLIHNVRKLELQNSQLHKDSPMKKMAEFIKLEGGLTKYDTQDLRMNFNPEP